MLETIKDILFSVIGWFEAFFKFIFDIILGLADLIALLNDVVNELPGYLTWFPPAAVAAISVTLVIVVFYKFFGRT